MLLRTDEKAFTKLLQFFELHTTKSLPLSYFTFLDNEYHRLNKKLIHKL